MSVRLRPMAGPDLAAVARLEEALFGEEAWSADMLAAELAAAGTGRYYLVAEEGGVLAGYAGLLAPGGGQADVLTIGVSEDRWGNGIGTALLTGLLAEARRRGCGEVYLEVREDNERAQRLYRQLGFARVGLRRGYYQPSGADALVMRRETVPGDGIAARDGAA
ncbi:MAG TPA: ribosomal protein S18-alanine N-acetyltransferase [Streptosporangiaceae bacterium]|nr:ribosomal protein S18-alanine N-acetyltransferase [Streptosporangiaceae bacterium]